MNIKSIPGKFQRLMRSKVASNSLILMISRVIQMILSLVVSVISAKFLGPANFGIVSYAGSIITFLTPIAGLGINSILAYECIQKPEEEGTIMGTALLLQLFSGFLCIFAAAAFALVFERNDPLVVTVIVLYSLELLFKGVGALEYWFQVHYCAKYVAVSTLVAYISVSAYKIILLAMQARVELFALSMCVDYLVLGMCYFSCYMKAGGPKFRISSARAKQLVQVGKSFILSGLMAAAYTQMDRIMLKAMLGEATVGYYTVAMSLISLLGFVFASIISASNPIILEHQKVDEGKYEHALVGRFSLIFYSSVVLAIGFTICSSFIVDLLYGEAYRQSASIVCVLTWTPLFTYWGVAKGVWFVSQRKQKYIKWLSLIGAITNVILNYVLIHQFGVIGAALATLVSEMAVNFLAGFFFSQIRKCSMMMLQAMNPKSLKYAKLLLE